MKITIVGRGSHADHLMSFLKAKSNYEVNQIEFEELDDKEGTDTSYVIAIGDNNKRAEIFVKLKKLRQRLPSFQIINDDITIVDDDRGIQMLSGVRYYPTTFIGENTILNTGCIVEHHACVGRHSHIAPGAIILGNAKIGEKCLVGAASVVLPHLNIADGTLVKAKSLVKEDINATAIK